MAKCVSATDDHYQPGDRVPIFVNKIGPFANPTETYRYYSLPFCKPQGELKGDSHTLGEILTGDRKMDSLYKLNFKTDKDRVTLCTKKTSKGDISKFRDAISTSSYFEMYIDDLPVMGFVGTSRDGVYMLQTHYHFVVGYKDDQISEVQIMETNNPLDYTDISKSSAQDITWTYTVTYEASTTTYAQRYEKLTEDNRFHKRTYEIHWLSIINSFVLIMLLVSFLTLILVKVVRNDFTALLRDEEAEDTSDCAWKRIQPDVFRVPVHKSMFCAFYGAGIQLLLLMFVLVFLGCIGIYYGSRGSLTAAAIILYSFTSGIAGYCGSSLYKMMGGVHWAFNLLTIASVFPLPLFVVWSVMNTVAWSYQSTAALPFGTIMVIAALWAAVTIPLTIMGGIAGRSRTQSVLADANAKLPKIPREIPKVPMYKSPSLGYVLAGFIPFSSIYIELFYIFSSVWGHKIYSLYGILFMVFILLLLVVGTVNVTLVYFQLNAENHRWWWNSMFNGGALGGFVYLYCIYYFSQAPLTGFLQGIFFFGYMAVICWGLFLILGSFGFYTSFTFVRYIYKQTRSD